MCPGCPRPDALCYLRTSVRSHLEDTAFKVPSWKQIRSSPDTKSAGTWIQNSQVTTVSNKPMLFVHCFTYGILLCQQEKTNKAKEITILMFKERHKMGTSYTQYKIVVTNELDVIWKVGTQYLEIQNTKGGEII